MTTGSPHSLAQQLGIPEAQWSAAEDEARHADQSIGQWLVAKGLCSETELLAAWGEVIGLPVLAELPLESIDTGFTQAMPLHFLRRQVMIPLIPVPATAPGQQSPAIIALTDPAALPAADDLTRRLKLSGAQLVLAPRAVILGALNMAYELADDSTEEIVQDMEDDAAFVISEEESSLDLLGDASDAPMIRLVNQILGQAIRARASDVHFEPHQDRLVVRYRIDGVMYELQRLPKWTQPALISRIKVMGRMDIAEKRLPQDGRMELTLGNQHLDVRLSTLPTAFGERVVMRLLNKSASVLRLTDLGFSDNDLARLQRLITQPNGILLVTGPTGSGKTTTLYAALSRINTPDINIITIEDPVEYQLDGISQIQVNRKIDFTFAKGLRSIVRQDPDVLLIGEIRDKETADIAVQSALTGHLVFSTLHTNDSPSAITRLVDIGVEPFLISSTVIAIVAQRLLRQLCIHCRKPVSPTAVALADIGIPEAEAQRHTIYSAVGCDACIGTGYTGRRGIYEILDLSEPLKKLLLQTHDANAIKIAALDEGMRTLRDDANAKILAGMTTIEEVLRVTRH